jgi:hypothetical protein
MNSQRSIRIATVARNRTGVFGLIVQKAKMFVRRLGRLTTSTTKTAISKWSTEQALMLPLPSRP